MSVTDDGAGPGAAAPPKPRSFGEFLNSPAVKLFAIGSLVLILTIPVLMIWGVLKERQGRAYDVEAEVGTSWGGSQTLAGPFVVVPYRYTTKVRDGDESREVPNTGYAAFLPEVLTVEGKAETRALRRSIFTVPVYRGTFTLSGRFGAANPASFIAPGAQILWDEAWVAMSVSDVRAFKESVALEVEGNPAKFPFAPTFGPAAATTSGIHAPIAAALAQAGFAFKIRMVLNGSKSLKILPAGGETRMALVSDWPHPSFSGAFLPDTREIRADGFSARWAVPNLARSMPERFILSDYGLQSYESQAFGVDFFQSVDFYQLVGRSLKYAVLFIGIVFLVAFLMEILSARPLHIVQYLFIGFAQCVFYLLLLSLSEHLGFEGAYGAAAGATILLITLYSALALKSRVRGFVMFTVLLLVYGLLYLLLRLEDYALLVGSLSVFALLAVTMFATLRVDWTGRSAKRGETV